MDRRIRNITIRGFKSIQSLENFGLDSLNILIGANGAGKSNFVDFFRLLRKMADESLQQFVMQNGADNLFYLGPKETPQLHAKLEFGENIYEFDLSPTDDGKAYVSDERVQYTGGFGRHKLSSIGQSSWESHLKSKKDEAGRMGAAYGPTHYVYEAVSSWVVYHFHDTSRNAAVRKDQSVRDWESLRSEAENIAPFLFHLRETNRTRYDLLQDSIRLVAPFFDEFILRPEQRGPNETIRLEWRQKGSDFPFQPNQLSDGTLRFICLATALQQPNLPSTIVFDEPELGLHPYAITILANLIQSAAIQTQVIVATQSPALLDQFSPENIIIVNRDQGRSTFSRLEPEALREWLDEYSIGELWRKNVVETGPTYE